MRRTTRRQAATAARPRVPLQPSAERLLEIQTALSKAGYLQAEPSGKWDDNSIAAMKRFQAEHSIPASGKINSLSLIALGLGPERGPAPGSDSVLEAPTSDAPAVPSSSADR
ncbi:MAG: peptidoglycan-binding protein [Bryobacterales bacterium]|nr:peptidoglycan-binding protein [Bryobacterales bacterium]